MKPKASRKKGNIRDQRWNIENRKQGKSVKPKTGSLRFIKLKNCYPNWSGLKKRNKLPASGMK